MRYLDLTIPAPQPSDRLAALTRHLHARLLDFGPGGPEVLDWDQATGTIQARFPGHTPAEAAEKLEACGVKLLPKAEYVLLYLNKSIPFEDLDYLWGCLFDILT